MSFPKNYKSVLIPKCRAYLTNWLCRMAFKIHHSSANNQFRKIIGAEEYLKIKTDAQNHSRGVFKICSRDEENRKRGRFEGAVVGAIKQCLHEYGSVTKKNLAFISKRVVGELQSEL